MDFLLNKVHAVEQLRMAEVAGFVGGGSFFPHGANFWDVVHPGRDCFRPASEFAGGCGQVERRGAVGLEVRVFSRRKFQPKQTHFQPPKTKFSFTQNKPKFQPKEPTFKKVSLPTQ